MVVSVIYCVVLKEEVIFRYRNLYIPCLIEDSSQCTEEGQTGPTRMQLHLKDRGQVLTV